MTTNIDRAARVLYDEGVGSKDDAYYLIHRLADAGHIALDLPKPTGTRPDGGATWQLEFDTVSAGRGHVWGGGYVEALTPDEARSLADALYAAADHAEEADRADA